MNAHEAAAAALPVELVELRPGRSLAVHRSGPAGDHVVILVHGSCASMLQWQAQAAHLSGQGFSVVLYDWLGCGRSPKPRGWGLYGMEELYEDLKAVVRAYQAKHTTLIGHSAGCGLCLRLAAECEAAGGAPSTTLPRPPSQLVLVAPVIGGLPAQLRLIFHLPLFILDYIQPSLSAGFKDLALHAETRKAATPEHEALLSLVDALQSANPMHMCKAYYRQYAGIPHTPPPVKAQVLIAVGEADLIAPAAVHAERLRSLLGCAREVALVPRSGHQCMQEQPAAMNKFLLDFLRSV